jgi:hypothetical protein
MRNFEEVTEMNITGSRDGKVFFIDDDKVMIDGKMYYEKAPQNLAQPDAYSLLGEVRKALNEKCFTTPDANWVIELDDVMEILSEHFT